MNLAFTSLKIGEVDVESPPNLLRPKSTKPAAIRLFHIDRLLEPYNCGMEAVTLMKSQPKCGYPYGWEEIQEEI
jgi:hypothetical protein